MSAAVPVNVQDKKGSAQHNRKAKPRGTDGRAGDGQGSKLRWTGIGRTVRLIKTGALRVAPAAAPTVGQDRVPTRLIWRREDQ